MNLFVVGVNHRSAPVEIRERLAFAPASLGEATCQLLGSAHLHEAAILSTCNRVEIYGLADQITEAPARVRQFLHEHHRLTENLSAHLYEHADCDCVRHLVEVACGLDSMVVGETEILGQLKNAYEAARQAGATGLALNRMFQKGFAAAKQIRSTTAIGRGSTSVGSVAVDLAEKIFRNLAECTVMVLGTGEMSAATARALRSRGAGGLLVCSRTQDRAEALAGELDGRAISYEQWPVEFPAVDIVISATAAPHPIITREKLGALHRDRRSRPLFLIDIAVPRDVERACGELADVYLYDIDDLQQITRDNREARAREIATCRELIDHHAQRLMEWFADNQSRLQQRYRRDHPSASAPVPAL